MTPGSTFTVALIGEVFADGEQAKRLPGVLQEARLRGAHLAVLPELPLNPWSAASKIAVEEDAEPTGGPRHRAQSTAARSAAIGLLGGAIVADSETGMRHNTALLFDARGALVLEYRKMHLPEEDGFWETFHYEAGRRPPATTTALGPRLGIQICSDANRLVGSQFLAAQRADIILAPRATEAATAASWLLVYRAMALTSAAFVISVNRPGPEAGAPSFAIDPSGAVLLETTDSLAVLTLDLQEVQKARRRYPGYLNYPAGAYAEAWSRLAESGKNQ